MLEAIASEVEKRPAWLFLAVAVVALIAWLQSRNTQQVVVADFAGGGAARAIDPQAAAIEEAAISAGQGNIATVASLIAAENSNQSGLYGSLAQTEAARQASLRATDAALEASLAMTDEQKVTSLASTEAGRQTSLAATEASLRANLAAVEAARAVGMYGIDASHDIANRQTDASVTISSGNNAASTEAARINATNAYNTAQINAATEAARLKAETDRANNDNQTKKDIARAADNTSIVTELFHAGLTFLAFLGF